MSQFRFVSLDEIRQFGVQPSPLRPAAIHVASPLLDGELPAPMWIVGAANHCGVGGFHSGARLRPRRDPEVRGQADRYAARIGRYDLAQREPVDRTDESAVARADSEFRQAGLELGDALVGVSDASDAARIDHVFDQSPRHGGREGLGLAAARAGQDDAMPCLTSSGQLLEVTLEFFERP